MAAWAQSHLEARLWNDVFVEAQAELGIPRGSIRVRILLLHPACTIKPLFMVQLPCMPMR